MKKISIRRAKKAISGLKDTVEFCKKTAEIPISLIVEIGSYVGDSTRIFATNFEQVVAVDPWDTSGSVKIDGDDIYDSFSPAIEKQFDELVEEFPNIKKLKMTGDSAVKLFEDESVDMVYIDALHTYEDVKNDIEKWFPKVKIGGVVAGHDYQKRFSGVIEAVEEFFGKKPEFLGEDTSWVFIKRKEK